MSDPSARGSCPAGSGLFCSRRHWSVYWLLIVLAVVPACWRAANAGGSPPDDWPMFSANDRSRWCQVAALVDHGRWEIDDVIAGEAGRRWDTIDKVRHRDRDGQLHFYSSKPPLLSVMVAGEYWLLKQLTGWRLTAQPAPVVRTLLVVNHGLGLILLLALLASLLEGLPVADWTRYFIVACGGWGTFLGSFFVTLNNHLPGAVCAMTALWSLDRVLRQGRGAGWRLFAGMGLASGLATAMELPAAALLAIAAAIGMFVSPVRWLTGFVPGAAVALVALIGTNWMAHGTWRLPYSFRGDGAQIAELDGDLAAEFRRGIVPEPVQAAAESLLLSRSGGTRPILLVEPDQWPAPAGKDDSADRWTVTDSEGEGLLSVSATREGRWALRVRENWYDYPGSYWRLDNPRRARVDRGEPDAALYAFHLLIGHHGVLSLTPLWLLAFAGMLPLATSRALGRRMLGLVILAVTIAVLGFYLTRGSLERNYGGMTCCARWLLWLTPLWLVAMVPVVQWLARWRSGQWLCLVLLAASMSSAMSAWNNPWTQPWPQKYLDAWMAAGRSASVLPGQPETGDL